MTEEMNRAIEAARDRVHREARWNVAALTLHEQKAKTPPAAGEVRIECPRGDVTSADPGERAIGIGLMHDAELADATTERQAAAIESAAMKALRSMKNTGTPQWLPPDAGWTPHLGGYLAEWPGGSLTIPVGCGGSPITSIDGYRPRQAPVVPDITMATVNGTGTSGEVLITDTGIDRIEKLESGTVYRGAGPMAENALDGEGYETLLLLWAINKFGVAPLVLRIKVTARNKAKGDSAD